MTSSNPPPVAVVAERRAMERSLARFLLVERGYVVAAEASTPSATAREVEAHRPDVLLIHENVALAAGPSALAAMQSASPFTRFVLLTPDRSSVAPELAGLADAIVEEGPGLQELASALEEPSAGPGMSVEGEARRPLVGGRRVSGERGQRWVERLQGAVAASVIVLAIVVVGRTQTPVPDGGVSVPPGPARAHLVSAFGTLERLAEELPQASTAELVSLAGTLLAERAVAEASGADVSALDEQISELLGPLLETLPPAKVEALLSVLGDLVEGVPVPSPSPTEGPEPQPGPDAEPQPEPSPETVVEPPPVEPPPVEPPAPTETPSPSPTETEPPSPSPSPTETPSPSPSPTETPTPTPTESPSPSPSPTETPSPSPSPSPTETPSPSPTETPSPSPSDTPSPSPSDTGPPFPSGDPPRPSDPPPVDPPVGPGDRPGAGSAGGIAQGIGALVVGSGLARWLSRRRLDVPWELSNLRTRTLPRSSD